MLNGLLWEVTTDDPVDGELTVIHGGARGADELGRKWAEQDDSDTPVSIEAFPADWDRYGKRAGYIRNQQMLDEGKPDIVLAFRSEGESKGTDMMIDLARKAGVPVYVVTKP